MKALALLLIGATLVLAGCGKVAEARNAIKTVSTTVDAAKEMAKAATGKASTGELQLTEESIRRYFAAVVKLKQKYPGIAFENAAVASIEAGATGKDLKRIVPAETDLSFDDYSNASGAIMSVLATGSVAQMGAIVPQLEAVDTSRMTPDQKTQHEAAITGQKQALEEARAQNTPEAQAAAQQFEMIMRISKEMGL